MNGDNYLGRGNEMWVSGYTCMLIYLRMHKSKHFIYYSLRFGIVPFDGTKRLVTCLASDHELLRNY
jgi:hypothetical protein